MPSARCRRVLVAMLAVAVGLAFTGLAAAQNQREIALIEKLGRLDSGLPVQGSTTGVTTKKLSPEKLMKLRLLELQSGAIARARGHGEVQAMVGPPLSEREKVIHVLNRLAFGPRPGEVDQVEYDGGWKAWFMQQLEAESIDNGPLEQMLDERYPWRTMSLKEIDAAYPYEDDNRASEKLRTELPESLLLRAAKSERQFEEVMCEFWRNHFCIDMPGRQAPPRNIFAPHYEEHVIRKHVFGKFKHMLAASATHPGMLHYLDNWQSRKNAWNENYARELMELHTLGVDKYYNEDDVLELTKILTGWSYDDNYNFKFYPEYHQPGQKMWLGRRVNEGMGGGEYAISKLADHKGTANFISWKLCRYLVNDNPPESLVKRVAAEFRRTDGDLKKVYLAIVESPEFFRRENFRAKFRTPFEYTVSALRSTNADLNSLTATVDYVSKMGQPIYQCMDPTGYFDQAEAWMDAGVLTTRWNYSWQVIRGGISGVNMPSSYFDKYNAILADKETGGAEKMVDQMINDLVGDDAGSHTREVLIKMAEESGPNMVLAVLLGSPAFQQQ